ncbi:Hypothetical predicted protein [Paramuricea clavata]|uniref:Uncharacterized protein n=1 Tax=Paramuricea clavata TaxID=317549 RepID=A0A7D9LYY0_PARCT|nr:Hypothetical predicted protein [Paramuricea clavata]
MAMHFGLIPPQTLDLNSVNVSANWKRFKQRYLNYEIAIGISGKEDATRVATLLTIIGNEAFDVYNTFVWATVGDCKKIAKVLEKFDEHCEPRKNVTYERYIFFTRAQETSETIDQYVTTLKRLSDTCEFGTLRDTLIKERIVLGVKNQKICERLL